MDGESKWHTFFSCLFFTLVPSQGSLSSILLKDLSVEIAWNQRIKWSHDVAKGIEYLHSLRPKIIHRDLRSDNVMVNAAGDAKVRGNAFANTLSLA